MKKNNRKKKFTILAIVLTVLIAAGFTGYHLLFNNLDVKEKTAIETEVGGITDDILADIKTGVDAKPVASAATEKERILSLYDAGFNKLQTEGNTIIARYLEDIKTDYAALKSSGAGKADYAKLAATYMNKADAYEASLDRSVDDLLSHLRSDLTAAGVSEKEIKASVAHYSDAYTAQKEIRQNLIMEKAKQLL